MKTITVTPETRAAAVREAAAALMEGGVAVIPTDTVYGIAAHPRQAAAVARICAIKNRPAGKPIALLAANLDAVLRHGAVLPPAACKLAERYWPGALTLVLTCDGALEGFRVPDHPLTRELLAACGGVLRVTSANLSGGLPAVNAAEALRDVGLEADVMIDDGACSGGVPSSVVKATATGLEIIREGALRTADLLHTAGLSPDPAAPAAPPPEPARPANG